MKTVLIIFFLTSFTTVMAQSDVIDLKEHKMVLQFNNGDSLSQASITWQLSNIRTAWPKASIEVVCHGPGLDLLVANKTKFAKVLAELNSQGVTFAACNNTMKRRKITKDDLLPLSVVVPSAMLELVLKQESGWSYLKGGH